MTGCHPDSESHILKVTPPEEPKLLQDLRNITNNIVAIFSQLGQLSEIISKHWDLNYKSDENLAKRISKLENYMQMEDRITASDVLCRLTLLEESQNKNLDRIDEQLKSLRQTYLVINEHADRIKQLEAKWGNRLVERVDNIEKSMLDFQIELSKLKQFIVNSAWKDHSHHFVYPDSAIKAPHKCPVCDGEGKNKNKLVMDGVKEPSTINLKNPDCHACEGKGIVFC